jgi:POT family proton-dependent oligopeptide transporter
MTADASRDALGHPRGIFLIFTTEIWERFSFYGMRGLLVLFLSSATLAGGFGWTASRALEIYATYTALVYIVPIIGGYLGDRYLGRRRAVVLGSALMMAGHFMMVVPGAAPHVIGSLAGFPVYDVLHGSGITLGNLGLDTAAVTAMQAYAQTHDLGPVPEGIMSLAYMLTSWGFYLALLLIIAGTGFFKSNMATMVGELYGQDDPRRDAGYTIYYTGANIGAFAANLVAGTIGELYGWHYGFSVAGIGMALGLAIFIRHAPRQLAGIGERPVARRENHPVRLSGPEKRRVAGIVLISLFTIVFWMGFEQGGGLLNIIIRDSVDRQVMGAEVPVTWFQSLNPMFIFLFAPLFVAFWGLLARRRIDLHPTTKYALGLGLMAASLVLLLGAQAEIDRLGYCSAWWLVAVFAVQTAGELAISPVSKSLVSRYAPKQIASPLMGCEFACYAAGAWLAGQIGAWALDTHASGAFSLLLVISVAAAGLCLLLRPVLDRLLGR